MCACGYVRALFGLRAFVVFARIHVCMYPLACVRVRGGAALFPRDSREGAQGGGSEAAQRQDSETRVIALRAADAYAISMDEPTSIPVSGGSPSGGR